jgi:hypothetical protein
MFGIGIIELIVLAGVALFMVGVPIAVLAFAVYLVRNQGSRHVADLEGENERLRDARRNPG